MLISVEASCHSCRPCQNTLRANLGIHSNYARSLLHAKGKKKKKKKKNEGLKQLLRYAFYCLFKTAKTVCIYNAHIHVLLFEKKYLFYLLQKSNPKYIFYSLLYSICLSVLYACASMMHICLFFSFSSSSCST